MDRKWRNDIITYLIKSKYRKICTAETSDFEKTHLHATQKLSILPPN